MLPVTALSVIVLATLYQALSIRVIRQRRTSGTAVGAGDDGVLLAAMRAQTNLVEYSVFFLVMTALCELNGVPWLWLAALAMAFVVGRAFHAYGMIVAEADTDRGAARFKWRRYGMFATFTVLQMLATTLLVALVAALF